MDIDLDSEPLGEDRDGEPVYLRDIWPSSPEIAATVEDAVQSDMFRRSYAEVFDGDERWHSLDVPGGRPLRLARVDLRPPAAVLRRDAGLAAGRPRTSRARACSRCSATRSRPTTSRRPARSSRDSPAGRYLLEQGVEPAEFNSYGARRGNHEVMMRGTFANIRLRNLLGGPDRERLPEGGFTRHLPDGEEMTIYDAAMRYAQEGVPLVVLGGKEYGSAPRATGRRRGRACSACAP